MTGNDINKAQTGPGNEPIAGNTHQNELVEELSKTPLTIEQQVAQLSKQVSNLNLGLNQVLDLFKEMIKKQTDTEVMIENLLPKFAENIATTTSQVLKKVDTAVVEIAKKIDDKGNNIKEQLNDMDKDIVYSARELARVKYSGDRPRRKYN